MVQQSLGCDVERIHEGFARNIGSPEKCERPCPTYKQEYLHVLGLWRRARRCVLIQRR
jgi:hypothetical protein